MRLASCSCSSASSRIPRLSDGTEVLETPRSDHRSGDVATRHDPRQGQARRGDTAADGLAGNPLDLQNVVGHVLLVRLGAHSQT